ncbi:MAG: TonB-dependent receptor [Acidobacteriota bacterium]
MTGFVRDSTNAVIPAATVTLTNIETGLVVRTQSDSSGFYVFPPSKVGTYRITAKATGFQTTVQENVHLNVQDRLDVSLQMRPGDVAETVTVTTAPPVLQTEQASVSQVMSEQTINNTPLNGRNWVYLAHLAAGVAPSNGARGAGAGDFNANGQRAEQNDFILDGIDNNSGAPDFLNGSSYAVQPPPDALSEFRLQTTNFSAEFGHSAGAVINATIKSGTNQIHGDLWEYVRNDAFDAKDFNALTIPKYRQNQFGATLGFPIFRNKLFFFGYTEANRIIFSRVTTSSVPTALMRQGDFSELLNPLLTQSGTAIPLYQPGSAGTVALSCNTQPNVICPTQVDQVAQNLLNLYPLPNTNGGKLYNNYTANSNARESVFQWGTRLDWNMSSRDQAFIRFSYVNEPQTYPSPLGPVADGGVFGADGDIKSRGESFAFSETHNFRSSLVNEFRFGYNYLTALYLQANNSTDVASKLGLGGIPTGPQLGGLPAITISGLSLLGTPGFLPNQKTPNDYQILDNVMKVIGKHSLRVGVDFQSHRVIAVVPPAARGTYTFNGMFTAVPGKANTGYGAADFLLNSMTSATLSNAQRIHDAQWHRAAYFEDDWKASPRLTLNLGLRYDSYQPSKELTGRQGNFYPIVSSFAPGSGQATLEFSNLQKDQPLIPAFTDYLAKNNVTLQYTSNPGMSHSQKLNFAPRLGLAYKVTDTYVVRAGFGIFFGGSENIGGPGFLESYPFQFTSTFPGPSSCTPGKCPTDGITLENGFQQALSIGLTNFVSQPAFTGRQHNIQTTYSEGFNLTVEKAIGSNTAASAAYVGSVNRHLQLAPNINMPVALTDPRLNVNLVQPFPTLGGLTVSEYDGVASYNSLQTKIEKRYSNNLGFLATYTWSHALDDARPPLGTGGEGGYRGINLVGIASDYSNSSWDITHRFTFNGYYKLPFGPGQHLLAHSRLAGWLVGGWATDIQFTAQSGFPFTVTTNLGSAGPHGGTAEAIVVRDPFAPGGTPDPSNPGITCAQKTRTLQHWYNPCAFANPPLAFPNASVAGSPVSSTRIVGMAALPYLGGHMDNVRGPGFERVNMTLFKEFQIFREQQLQLRADVFNLMNTPAYGQPSVASDASTGGQITAARPVQSLAPDARFFQLSAKYSF